MTDKPRDLDKHRGTAAHKATEIRRALAEARARTHGVLANHEPAGPGRPGTRSAPPTTKRPLWIATDRALLDRMNWQARNPDGAFNLASVVDIQDFFRRTGIIDKTAPAERLIDPRYAAAAAKEFGPFVVTNKASTLAGCR